MADTLDPALPDDVAARAERVLDLAHQRDILLTTAESCTGGLLAALLTDVPGKSHVFERGFVVYSKQAKCDLLDIARDEVERCGAVSRAVAVDMAAGALRESGAGLALAITGFAGPGDPGDEEGLVHFACVVAGHPIDHREEHFGPIGRQGVRVAALRAALEMMDQALSR